MNKETEIDKIVIKGVTYVPETALPQALNLDGLEYCIVRTYTAGVFAGYLKERNGKEGTILQARRLWYWSGASSLSEACLHGFANPSSCKFPEEVPSVILTEIIEILPCTEKARKSIKEIKVWSQK